jgi:hypothetical protein
LKRRTAVKRNYHTIDKQGQVGERKLTEFLIRNGQALLPMMELVEQSRMAIDELIDVMGRGQRRGCAGTVGSPSGRRAATKWPESRNKERPGPAKSAGMEGSPDGCI